MRIHLGVLCLLLTATSASAQSLEQQALCAKQAKIVLDEYSHSPLYSSSLKHFERYKNHYNTKLNKCFIAIESRLQQDKDEFYFLKVLIDAFENRAYAYYTLPFTLRYHDASPTCVLIPTSQTQTHCSSEDEYNAFVAKYMEE